jgi:hypothetical protein
MTGMERGFHVTAKSDSCDATDSEWHVSEPLLPNKPRGVPRVDDRRVLNGIFWTAALPVIENSLSTPSAPAR